MDPSPQDPAAAERPRPDAARGPDRDAAPAAAPPPPESEAAPEAGRPEPGPERRRLGLFGGSFDPVHRGHLYAAEVACRAFRLDRLVFVPAAVPPHKLGRRLAPGPDRLAMVRLALVGHPGWTASALELERAGPSYTIDTVAELPAAVGEPADALVCPILGSDNLPGLPRWRRAEELILGTRPIVVLRDDDSPECVEALRTELSPAAYAHLARGIVHAPSHPGRATDVRAALAAGADLRSELPGGVYDYIVAHGLYGVPAPRRRFPWG